jgi:hypothetical protein
MLGQGTDPCRVERNYKEWASKETGRQIILMTARFLLHFAKKEIFCRQMRIYLLLCSMPELALFPDEIQSDLMKGPKIT